MSTVNDLWEDIDDGVFLAISENESQHVPFRILNSEAEPNGGRLKRHIRSKEINHNTRPSSPKKNYKVTENTAGVSANKDAPLNRFRRGYLWVSDLLSQSWCEQQMVYNFTLPTIAVESPVINAGSDLHLARELEVQDVVQVKVTSSEDIFAVKVLNLCQAAENFLSGVPVRREIPIFGAPFEDVFLVGMIDEIRCDQDNFTLDLLEFKTRNYKTFPSKSQSWTHNLQVMIYKHLFDDLVTGKTSKEVIVKHLLLDLNKELGDGIMEHIKHAGLKNHTTLDTLLELLFERMSLLPRIGQMYIEYCYQEDSSTIGIKKVENETKLLHETVQIYLQYWKGRRKERGVDIEDAWKCQRCDFADVCEWRSEKAQEYTRKNNSKRGKHQLD